MPTDASLSPRLGALMCDGMGWFEAIHYKRMLLVFDEVHYLLPGASVSFMDWSGEPAGVRFGLSRDDSFVRRHDILAPVERERLVASARELAAVEAFAGAVSGIPRGDQLYTWRVVNCDGSLTADGRSPGLGRSDVVFAHALLLLKMLHFSDSGGLCPISGQPHMHALLGALGAPSRGPRKVGPVVRRLAELFVPDAELRGRTQSEIVAFKRDNADLFDQFSLSVREYSASIAAVPLSPGFEDDIDHLLRTRVYREQQAIQGEMRAAWEQFFKSAVKAGVGAAVALGVSPVALGDVSLGAALLGGVAALPWLTGELMELAERRRDARSHGLYYLMEFPAGA